MSSAVKHVILDHIFYHLARRNICAVKQCLDTLCIACPRCYCESVLSIPRQFMARHWTSLNAPGEWALSQTVSDTRRNISFLFFLYISMHAVADKTLDFREQSKAFRNEVQNNTSLLNALAHHLFTSKATADAPYCL